MVYLAAPALIGLICASAFRWPVMLTCSAVAGLASFAFTLLSAGGHLGQAALHAVLSTSVLQVAYVLGGFVGHLKPRVLGAKRNIKA